MLAANTEAAGWQWIALFKEVSASDLQDFIDSGELFLGYEPPPEIEPEVGPLGDDAPGGLAVPTRPDIGSGGGGMVSDDVIVDGRVITGNAAAAAGNGTGVRLELESFSWGASNPGAVGGSTGGLHFVGRYTEPDPIPGQAGDDLLVGAQTG
jgi:hypothetical protein